MTKTSVVAVVILTLAPAAMKSVHAQSQGVDLSGTWVLNTKLSDDPSAIMKQRMEAMHASGGGGGSYGGHHGGGYGGGAGYSGGGGHHGGGYGGGDGGSDHQGAQDRARQFAPAQKLVIVENAQQIMMIPEGRDTVTVVPDGKKHERKTPAGTATVEAHWNDAALEVAVTSPGGHEITREYRINADGRLEVITELPAPNGGDKTKIVMRYDEATADTKQK